MPEDWTIGRLLQWTTDYLKQHGSESPRLDAEVLLAEARGCKRIELYTAFDQPASDELRNRFRELVKQRAEGKPVAYLVGRREFYSLDFRVTPNVLIPRPETEHLVVRLLDIAKERGAGEPISIVDVGTGSGIIAVCAAKWLPAAQVVATDHSHVALDAAKSNAAAHGVAERIEWVEGDLLETVGAGRMFDIVASNPPYISEAEYAALPKTVKDFEPSDALVAGPKGTEVIERLVPQAAERLKPDGWLLVEVSPMIEPAARSLLEADGRFIVEPTIKDLAGLPRVVQGRRK